MHLFAKISIALFIILAVFSVPCHFTYAVEEHPDYVNPIIQSASFRWNNENWFTTPHPKVKSFTVRPDGSAYGLTETDVPFTQENVENELKIRIQKFVMQDHYHYIIEGEVVYSLKDFSKKLVLAQTKIHGS